MEDSIRATIFFSLQKPTAVEIIDTNNSLPNNKTAAL